MTVTRAVLALLAVVVGSLAIAAPYVFSAYLVGILATALILALFTASINLMAGWVGLVTLGQAGILAAAGYAVAYVAVRDASYPEQLLAGVAAGLLVTLVFAVSAMRTSGIYFLMITLAQGMVVWGMAYRLTGVTGGDNGIVGVYRPESIAPYWIYYYVVLAVVAVCFVAIWFITRSPLGLTFQGLRDSETRMVALGYRPAFYRFYAYTLSGVFATVAGILFVYLTEFISPANAEFMLSAHGVLMMILGGVGTIVGPLVGALVIVYIENVVSVRIGRWPTVMGVIFIFVVLFARTGIVGGIASLWARTPWGARHDDERSPRENDVQGLPPDQPQSTRDQDATEGIRS